MKLHNILSVLSSQPLWPMGSKLYWTIQIILLKYQSLRTSPIHFGEVQIVLVGSKL